MSRFAFLTILVAFFFLVACNAAYSQCPKVDVGHGVYTSGVYSDGVVAFCHSYDPDYPLNVLLYRHSNACEGVRFDKYSVECSAPKIDYVFGREYRGKPLLFVIVSWRLNNRGAGVYGKFYQVYAYEKDGKDGLKVDQAIVSRNNMTGIEGTDQNRTSRFHCKTPSGVDKLLGLSSDK
ncbi:MAG: hypothetical protein AB7U34_07495 [Novosphingobium sp.]